MDAIVADKMFAMKVFEKHADKPAKYEALRMAARHDMREMAEVLLRRVNSFTDLRIEWGWKAGTRKVLVVDEDRAAAAAMNAVAEWETAPDF